MTSTVEPVTARSLQVTRAAALETVAPAAAILLDEGQTTERTVVATERLGRVLGLPLRVLPLWDGLAVHVEDTPFADFVPAMPLGVHMGRVLAAMTVIDRVSDGTLPIEAAGPALAAAKRLPPASTPRFVLFAAIGAASLGVIFGALDGTSLLLIALLRRGLAARFGNPFAQPLDLLQTVVTNGTTAFLIIFAMTFGLILPRLLFAQQPSPVGRARD